MTKKGVITSVYDGASAWKCPHSEPASCIHEDAYGCIPVQEGRFEVINQRCAELLACLSNSQDKWHQEEQATPIFCMPGLAFLSNVAPEQDFNAVHARMDISTNQ